MLSSLEAVFYVILANVPNLVQPIQKKRSSFEGKDSLNGDLRFFSNMNTYIYIDHMSFKVYDNHEVLKIEIKPEKLISFHITYSTKVVGVACYLPRNFTLFNY